MKVAILMGSESDWDTIKAAKEALDSLGVESETHVMSAHRSPGTVAEFASNASASGIGVIIAAAGGAAHLAGTVAAHTSLPVIGVPMVSGSLAGLDALLATVQMPSGVPVATVAIGKSGSKNAGVLAAQILALSDEKLVARLAEFKKELGEKVKAMDANVKKLAGS